MIKTLYKFIQLAKLLFILGIAIYFFILPPLKIMYLLSSKELKSNQIHPYYFQLHHNLSDRYDTWLAERLASNRAQTSSTSDISGTEWPLFGTVFYLWTTESLQNAWEKDQKLFPQAPKEYTKETLDLSAQLLADPNQAEWVQKHWGDTYLEKENLFYRMLLIGGLTSYQKLTGSTTYENILKNQTISLAKEIDQSPHGLLDDYPNQCYPVDIVPAIALIHRANALLQIDDTKFLEKAKRGFQGEKLDPTTRLPSYVCDSKTGKGIGPARGVGISYMLIWSAEMWPEVNLDWYEKFEKHYWKSNMLFSGWREFAKESGYPSWYVLDVDAGPVLAGLGTGASAFGLGASLVNGRIDQAYPLLAEALTSSWPLPNDTLLTPQLLSNISDAPLLGESALLFIMSRQSSISNTPTNIPIPGSVIVILLGGEIVGLVMVRSALRTIWNKETSRQTRRINDIF